MDRLLRLHTWVANVDLKILIGEFKEERRGLKGGELVPVEDFDLQKYNTFILPQLKIVA